MSRILESSVLGRTSHSSFTKNGGGWLDPCNFCLIKRSRGACTTEDWPDRNLNDVMMLVGTEFQSGILKSL